MCRQLLIIGPSLSSPNWMCWLLRQPSFSNCTLIHYWILLLPRQRVSTNRNLILQLLLLGRRLKACGALCGKVGETEPACRKVPQILFVFCSDCSSEEENDKQS